MLYYLFDYLEKLNFPGAGMFHYISFRAGLSVIIALLFTAIWGRKIIDLLQKLQIGETIRDLGLEGQMSKKGTPTMGGLIILGAILFPVLLFCRLDNVYVILMLITTVWIGLIGYIDDYIKVVKKNKEGLAGKFKIVGQVGLGLIVGLTLYLSDDAVIRDNVWKTSQESGQIVEVTEEIKSNKTTIPFIKNNNFDYSEFLWFLGDKAQDYAWFLYVLVAIFIITAVSNGANLTDGLDGLAAGSSAVIGTVLGIFAYVSSNVQISDYLNIMYIPHSEELVIFAAAFVGATIGFLWYNSFPAQVFMGDTGSLTLGGIIAVFALIVRKELLIPIFCATFFVESLSVLLQVFWFKRTKKKYGEGRRIFLMAPLHHQYQKRGIPEPKIVTKFWIVAIILGVFSIVTLKIR